MLLNKNYFIINWMATLFSFDILGKVDLNEIRNGVENSIREIKNRFDFKNSKTEIELLPKEFEIILQTEDSIKLEAVQSILLGKLSTRGISPKVLTFQPPTEAGGTMIKQMVKIQNGLPQEKAKEIVQFLKKSSFKKVQATIQGDFVRISAKSKNELQEIIQQIKDHDFKIFLDIGNFRP